MHVAAHAGDDVALALLAEEAQRERRDLLVELVADVAHHARADGNDGGRGQEVGSRLEEGHEGQGRTDDEQHGRRTPGGDVDQRVVVNVVGQDVLQRPVAPGHGLRGP